MSDNADDCIKALQGFRKSVTNCHNKIEIKFPNGKLRNVKDCKITDEDNSRLLSELSETKKKVDELNKYLDVIRISILEAKDSIHQDIQLRDNRGRQRRATDSGISSCDSAIEIEPYRKLITQPSDDESLKLTLQEHYQPIMTQPSDDEPQTELEDSEA